MRNDGATWGTIRPKPDERYGIHGVGPEKQNQQPFQDALNRSIDRPARKGDFLPVPEPYSLEMLPYRYGEERPDQVISIPQGRFGLEQLPLAIRQGNVPLML